MTVTPSVTLRELLAGNLRRLRSATTATVDDVARAAQQHGLPWTASWVQSAERGQKAISAEQLLLLPLVLTTALAHRVSLADLLLGDATVQLGDEQELAASTLRDVITAPPFRRSFTGLVERDAEADRRVSAAAQAAQKMRDIGRSGFGDIDMRTLTAAEQGATDVETKLAKKLGVPEIVVIAASAKLFGRSLTEERSAQLLQPGPDGKLPTATAVGKNLAALIAERIDSAQAAV